jgi:RNA polymerase sigma factor (sigma-70 family)
LASPRTAEAAAFSAAIQEERVERAHRAAKAQEKMAQLTPGEREVIRLQAEGVPTERTREIPVEERQDAMDKGWDLVAQVNGVAIVKNEVRVRLTYEQIGQRLGLTARQVHRRLVSAKEKLRSMR